MINASSTPFYRAFTMLMLFFVLSHVSYSQYDVAAYNLLISNPDAFRAQLLANPGTPVNLKKANLNGVDLSRMELSGADLSYCQLEGANLKESNLTNAILIGSNIKNADFSRTNLTHTDFSRTNATGANFKDAFLKETLLEYLLIQEVHQLNPAKINPNGEVVPKTK